MMVVIATLTVVVVTVSAAHGEGDRCSVDDEYHTMDSRIMSARSYSGIQRAHDDQWKYCELFRPLHYAGLGAKRGLTLWKDLLLIVFRV